MSIKNCMTIVKQLRIILDDYKRKILIRFFLNGILSSEFSFSFL